MNETLVRDAHNEPSKTCMCISYKHFTALLGNIIIKENVLYFLLLNIVLNRL